MAMKATASKFGYTVQAGDVYLSFDGSYVSRGTTVRFHEIGSREKHNFIFEIHVTMFSTGNFASMPTINLCTQNADNVVKAGEILSTIGLTGDVTVDEMRLIAHKATKLTYSWELGYIPAKYAGSYAFSLPWPHNDEGVPPVFSDDEDAARKTMIRYLADNNIETLQEWGERGFGLNCTQIEDDNTPSLSTALMPVRMEDAPQEQIDKVNERLAAKEAVTQQ